MRLRELRPLLRMPLRVFQHDHRRIAGLGKDGPCAAAYEGLLYQATRPLIYGDYSTEKQRPRDQSPLVLALLRLQQGQIRPHYTFVPPAGRTLPGHSGERARPARLKHWIHSFDTDCAIAPLSICGTPERCLGGSPVNGCGGCAGTWKWPKKHIW